MKNIFLFAFFSLSILLSGCSLFGANFQIVPKGNDKYYIKITSSFMDVPALKSIWFPKVRAICREDGFAGFRFDSPTYPAVDSGYLSNGQYFYWAYIECVGESWFRDGGYILDTD